MNESHTIQCPLCHDKVDKLLYRYHLGNERQVIERIKAHNPGWSVFDGACGRCVDYYHTEIVIGQRMLPEVGPYFPIRSADDFMILPVGLRLDADTRFTGKGVTICFIDSGFYLHPDLTAYKNRIKKILDITEPKRKADWFTQPHPESWHGTMTSVVCAGDGYLSNGLYKGIAPDASLVLLKVQNDNGKITTANIVKALEWAMKNHERYDIRIVNMSLGDDEPVSYKRSEIDRLAEELVEQGITVVTAAGNDEHGTIKPPANSPQVITVGGIDDGNRLEENETAYHSPYGLTADGVLKPEILAHAIWIAAPILPGTKESKEAKILYQLLNVKDDQLSGAINENNVNLFLRDVENIDDPASLRESIIQRIQTCKYISPHYMHVDGTSFAAPVVCAVIAQLLELNPVLTPTQIREILFGTAKRIETLPAIRQGYGVIQPRKAILKILKRSSAVKPDRSPCINRQQQTIEFFLQHECASQVSLAGSFNQWTPDVLLMDPLGQGWWKIELPMLPAGRYTYKFYIDNESWLEDVANPLREPDGYYGFNNVLIIEN
ncbi:MAG: S8 family serine peptidase [Bacteroidetes bacterium]|nr:S8 family serine peptidase [Bacteroidota bacterium]